MTNNKMLDFLDTYITVITFIIDIAAGLVVGISAISAFVSFLRHLREKKESRTIFWETIRLRLARGLLLALDFAIGSDILKTLQNPSLLELLSLAVVVGIRIILTWSLSKEIEGGETKGGETKGGETKSKHLSS